MPIRWVGQSEIKLLCCKEEIQTAESNKLFVRASLDQPPSIEHKYEIGMTDGREAMSDYEGGTIAKNPFEISLDGTL